MRSGFFVTFEVNAAYAEVESERRERGEEVCCVRWEKGKMEDEEKREKRRTLLERNWVEARELSSRSRELLRLVHH